MVSIIIPIEEALCDHGFGKNILKVWIHTLICLVGEIFCCVKINTHNMMHTLMMPTQETECTATSY